MQGIVRSDLEEIKGNLGDRIESFEGHDILITGGAGFLGYYFVHLFLSLNDTVLKRPCRVICVDSFARDVPAWIRTLKKDYHKGDLEIVKADVSELDVSGLGSADYIIHAASIASPTFYRK